MTLQFNLITQIGYYDAVKLFFGPAGLQVEFVMTLVQNNATPVGMAIPELVVQCACQGVLPGKHVAFLESIKSVHNSAIAIFDLAKLLSLREQEVLQLLGKGLISKQIADQLFISVNTVNTHRQRIIEKLKVSNTAEAVQQASTIGII